MVSERRKAVAFPSSPFTGSRGQRFLLVWMGGKPWLRSQRGGTHSPWPRPKLSTYYLDWTRGHSKAGRAGAALHRPGRANLHDYCPLPPREWPRPGANLRPTEKGWAARGLAVSASTSLLLKGLPRCVKALSLTSQARLHPTLPQAAWQGCPSPAPSCHPQLLLGHLWSHWLGLGESL